MEKKTLSNQQWKKIREDLNLFNPIFLLIDGIPFTLKEERSKQKIVVVFYICGWLRGEWIQNHFFTKYHRRVEKCILSKKDLKKQYNIWKRLEGKKYADEWKVRMNYSYRTPLFPSFTNFQGCIKKVADSIERIEYKAYKELSDTYRNDHPEYFGNEKN